jgi:hypothetical protein
MASFRKNGGCGDTPDIVILAPTERLMFCTSK